MSGSGRRSAQRGRSSTVRVVVALACTLLIGTTVGLVLTQPDDGTNGSTTTSTAGLDEGGEELVALLRRRADLTYHARYEGSSGAEQAPVVLETWQRPPLVRQDANVDVQGQSARTSSFVLDGDAIRCTAIGDTAPYTCRAAGEGELGDVDPTAGIVSRLNGATVTARDSVVNGRPVRCFDLVAESGSSEMCVDEEGIPVLIRGGDSELELVVLDDDVPDNAFEPPAPVQE